MRPLPQGSASAFLQEPPVSWASWTRVTSVVLDAADTASNITSQRAMIDESNKFVYFSDSIANIIAFVALDGTGYTLTSATDGNTGGAGQLGQSLSTRNNLYCIVRGTGANTSKVYILNNGALLQTIDETGNFSSGSATCSISPSGKYIVIIGGDKTNTKRRRLAVYQGNASS